ncbi:efflux transporter outer membrane subunit [Spirosoma fluminis]
MKISYLIPFLILSVCSCRVGKEFNRPELNLPTAYRQEQRLDTTSLPLPPVRDFFANPVLQQLIDTALVFNKDLQIAIKNMESARTSLKQVRLNYLPDLTAQIQASRVRSARNSFAGLGNEAFVGQLTINDFTANVGLNWEVNLWGRVARQKEEALYTLLQSEEVKRGIQTRLVADVASAYYSLLMLDQQRAIALQSQVLSDTTLLITQAQFKVGEATSLAIQQASAQVEVTRQLIPLIEQSINQQENALRLLCGQYARSVIRQRQPHAELTLNPTAGFPVSMLAARPDVRAAENALRVSVARTGLAQIALYPRLTITAQSGLSTFQASNWLSIPGSLFWNAIGGLTQPIFQRGQLKTQYELASLEQDKAALTFQQAVLVGYSEVSTALIAYQKLDEQLKAATRRRQALEEGIGSTRLLFKHGMANYLEIITAQSNFLQSRLDQTQLERNKVAVTVELYRALGGGWK